MKRRITVFTLVAVIILARTIPAKSQTTENDWLLGQQLQIYVYLLKSTDISDGVRDKLQEGLHRFTFEYWLLCQTNVEASSPYWRGELRERLHREGKNERYFNDPAGLLPFFKDGNLVLSVAVSPVNGLDLSSLKETDYRELAREFRLTFFDATNIFPVAPVPPVSAIVIGKSEDDRAIAEAMGGKSWRLVSLDRLPIRFQREPFRVFLSLTETGQYYYLPSFLRMCERDRDQGTDLPRQLLGRLASDTPELAQLRSRLTEPQKQCLFQFFADWYRGDTNEIAFLNSLGKEFKLDGKK